MKKIMGLHCQKCRSTTNRLYVNSTYKNTKYYMCIICGTNKQRKYASTEKGKNIIRNAIYKSIKKYSEKQNTRYKVRDALKSGKLIKSTHCEVCGVENHKLDAHHEDYEKPLEVVWCCRTPCHKLLDKILKDSKITV